MLNICIMRLSALGDVTHVAAVVNAIQTEMPDARISWVIGKTEAKLLNGMPGVEFWVVDKASGWRAYTNLRRSLGSRRFDVLLQMQLSLRAGILSTLVRAPRRIGYERSRTRDFHGLFVNERLAAAPEKHHVLDVLMGFAEHLGVKSKVPGWRLPICEAAQSFALEHLPQPSKTLLVSPCSSHARRDWSTAGYAKVIDHAYQAHGLHAVIVGGRSSREQATGDAITKLCTVPVKNLVGQDTLPQLVAMLSRAQLVLTPDSGPAHIANAVGTDVLGLYAATDPQRSGPYNSRQWCINQYGTAMRRWGHKFRSTPRWGKKYEFEGVMDLITQGDVIATLDKYMLHLQGA